MLSPEPSAARWHARITTPRGALALERAARGRDRVIVHYRPDCFPLSSGAAARRATAATLRAALRGVPSVEVVLHGDATAESPMAAALVDAGAHVVEHAPPPRPEPSARAADQWPAAGGPGGSRRCRPRCGRARRTSAGG